MVFHKKPGYQAFAKQMGKHIKGIMVVDKDSRLQSVEQLQGQTLVFPSPAAFDASILPRAYLKSKGINFKPKYVMSHDSVYYNVVKKIYPAGGGIIRTLNNTETEIFSQLKIFWQSEPFTPHAFAAHPKVETGIIVRLRNSFMNMHKTQQRRELLNAIEFTAIESAYDQDWNDIRKLGLTDLDNYLPVQNKTESVQQ